MVACFIKSNWLDNIIPVDDTTFRLDLEFQWVGTLHGQAISVDQDQLLNATFPYSELATPSAFAAHLKSVLSARATELGYAGFTLIEIMAPTRIAVP